MNHETLLIVFRLYNEGYKKQAGKIKSDCSYWEYYIVYNHLKEFIKHSNSIPSPVGIIILCSREILIKDLLFYHFGHLFFDWFMENNIDKPLDIAVDQELNNLADNITGLVNETKSHLAQVVNTTYSRYLLEYY